MLQETSLTTVFSILEAGIHFVMIEAKVNAELDCHACCVRKRCRCECAPFRSVANAIKGQTVGPVMEAQREEPT
jgi:hypothetical protein